MIFLKVTENGEKVLVPLHHVVKIRDRGSGCSISLRDGYVVLANETMEQLESSIQTLLDET